MSGPDPVQRLAGPPGVEPDQVDGGGCGVVFQAGFRQAEVAGAADAGDVGGLGDGALHPGADPVPALPCIAGLLEHLATLPRNQVRFAGATTDVPMLTEPTSTQREAFDLIGVPIPLTLK